MSIWAIGDLHLSFGVAGKNMDVFGPEWASHADKIRTHWEEQIAPDDLVLVPGDISWGSTTEEAAPDLEWLGALPGTKVMIKGNHDYWWHSISKVQKILPPSCHVIQNNAFDWNGFSIGGARLWDSDEYSFNEQIAFFEREIVSAKPHHDEAAVNQKIFARELLRLESSLKALNPKAKKRIAMTHYPPIGPDFKPSKAAALLEKYGVEICVYGHLHSLKPDVKLSGEARGVSYHLTACDYLAFSPLKIF